MFDVNVLGIVRVTQALLPALRADGGGLVINLGSTAGRVAYEGGGGYTAAKHGVKVLTQTLRLERAAEPLRFTEIAPGMVKTEEFTLKRFQGDRERYDAVYAGVQEPLVAEDIAETVRWEADCRAHVNVDGSSYDLGRRPPSTRCIASATSEPPEQTPLLLLWRGSCRRGVSLRLRRRSLHPDELVPGDVLQLHPPVRATLEPFLTQPSQRSASPKVA